ncbi:alpha carbonic anhydrase [Morchella snyderi]|nr:alpha carbonic anhydrase [Morchella snyderi]
MLNLNFLQVAAIFTFSLSAAALSEPKCGVNGYVSPWGYNSENGPIAWPTFTKIPGVEDLVATCNITRSSTHQSPVVIRPSVMNKTERVTKLAWGLGHKGHKLEFEFDGHTVEAKLENKDTSLTSTLNGDSWKFEQFHFHTPSEHTYGAVDEDKPARFPLEVHFVHSSGGRKAVLGIWFKLDDFTPNPFLEEVTKNINDLKKCGDRTKEPLVLSEKTFGGVQEFVEAHATIGNSNITTYEGSLTTPPCTEGVNWFVVQQPMIISTTQLEKFQGILGHNSRCTKSEWNKAGWSVDVDDRSNNCKA